MPNIAAIDLGSNSFHMLIVSTKDGINSPLFQCGRRVQLGADMHDGTMTDEAIQRGLACLRDYRAIILQHNVKITLTAATSALRIASNSAVFCRQASLILDCDINIISGEHEAKLIYLGVITSTPLQGKQMVVDIGGGSTEFILGENSNVQYADSVSLGCLSHFQKYYSDSSLNAEKFQRSVDNAKAQIGNISAYYESAIGHIGIGCSGVVEAILSVIQHCHWGEQITMDGLSKARTSLLKQFSDVYDVRFEGLRSDRRALFVAGLAIMIAIFEILKPSAIIHVNSALREGIIVNYLHPYSR